MANSVSKVFMSGAKTVSSAGTAEALAASQRVSSLSIIGKAANTGKVYIGASDVASSTNGGIDPGQAVEIKADHWIDLSDVYIDVGTTGEGVDFYATLA